MKRTLSLSLAIATTLAATCSQAAIGYDSQSMAMGGTGVASAHYLTAPFYNPAQLTNYDDSDDIGLLLPTFGISVHDKNDLIDKIDTFQGLDPASNPEAWKNALLALDGSTAQANIHLGAAVALPNRHLSAALYVQSQATVFILPKIDQSDINTPPSNINNLKSEVRGLAGGTLDMGVALAKAFELQGQSFSVGVTPKLQTLYIVNYKANAANFDTSDFDYNTYGNDDTKFNLDLGLSYQPFENVTLAFAGQNLIKQSLENNIAGAATYIVEPTYTLGASYDNGWLQLNLDWDLNETKYFEQLNYSSQYVRLGAELNAWDWAQLRAGYAASLTDTADNMLTAGIGLHPFGAFGLDLAGQYSADNGYSASAQLIFTF